MSHPKSSLVLIGLHSTLRERCCALRPLAAQLEAWQHQVPPFPGCVTLGQVSNFPRLSFLICIVGIVTVTMSVIALKIQ